MDQHVSEPATPPRNILPVVAPSVRVASPVLSPEHPLPASSYEFIIAVPNESVHEFITYLKAREWENAAPYIHKPSETVINALIAQRVPHPHIYTPSLPKRKHGEVEEAQNLENSPPKRQRMYFHNRADGRKKPNRLLEIKRREENKLWEQRKREMQEREEENRRHEAKLANFHVSSDDEDEPSPPHSPSITAQDQAQIPATITSPQTQIAQVATDVLTTDSTQTQVVQEVVTASIQSGTESLATPQPTRRWGLGGLTQSVGRIFRFGNQPSINALVAPASAPHAPTQLALTASEVPPPVENAPSESILDAEPDVEVARRDVYMNSPFPHYPLPPLPRAQPLTEAAPAELNAAKPSRRARKDKNRRGTESQGALHSAASGPENSTLVHTDTNDDSDNDEPLEPHYDEESFRKALNEQREQDLKDLRKHKRKLEFELKKKQKMMDQEIEEKVRAQLADESKKRRRTSPEEIPNPPGVSYGMDPHYFVISGSDDDDDDLPDTPTKRPSKRQRSGPALLTPPCRTPRLAGSAKSARPYTGSMFADPPPENIFDPTTHRRGGLLPKLDRDTERKAEAWDANPRLSGIPEAHRNYAGSFVVPTSPDSSSDEESTASTTPTGSPSKSAAPDTGSSETPSGSWTQPPPRAPVPSPAALPKQLTHTPTTQPDLLAKAREQANRFAPSRPSGLRNASRVSLSTIASEGDREDDQADDVPAPTPTTSKTPATFALLTEPAKISPTKQASINNETSDATLDSGHKSSSGSTALVSHPDIASPVATRHDTGSLTLTRPDANSLITHSVADSPTTTGPDAGSPIRPDANSPIVIDPEADSPTFTRTDFDSPADQPLTLESLQRPSLALTSKLIPCDPYNSKTYRSVAAAMASLDPIVRNVLRNMKPEEFVVPSFDDFSWAYPPSAHDPAPNVDAALAQVARLTGPIDPAVEAALCALKREDLAPYKISKQPAAIPESSSTIPTVADSEEAALMKQALAENWTEEAKQNAANFFEGAMLLHKDWQQENTGQSFEDYFRAHDQLSNEYFPLTT